MDRHCRNFQRRTRSWCCLIGRPQICRATRDSFPDKPDPEPQLPGGGLAGIVCLVIMIKLTQERCYIRDLYREATAQNIQRKSEPPPIKLTVPGKSRRDSILMTDIPSEDDSDKPHNSDKDWPPEKPRPLENAIAFPRKHDRLPACLPASPSRLPWEFRLNLYPPRRIWCTPSCGAVRKFFWNKKRFLGVCEAVPVVELGQETATYEDLLMPL
jgi:hypothetical protein